jgi:nucleoside-diphosphate-sugar epimerase
MKLIVGCGYLGCRVAARWLAAGQTVLGLVRDVKKGSELLLARWRTEKTPDPFFTLRQVDVTRPETLGQLPTAETVLIAVGFDPRGGRSRREVYVEGLRNVLDALPADSGRIVFISSTGVLGEHGGRWVDEDSPCYPLGDSGRALLDAEAVLRDHALGSRSIILRLAGLYGPGRLPSLAGMKKVSGTIILENEERFFKERSAEIMVPDTFLSAGSMVNLIHVDDAAQIVLAAESRGRPPRTYLVADGHPVERRTYLSYLAEVSGLPPPRFRDSADEAQGVAAAAAETRGGNKQVSNARMLAELGVELAYPSYREGVAASVGQAPRA